MKEATKTMSVWSAKERSLIMGEGIDIGCGNDPIHPSAIPFDRDQGDANHITRYISKQFDYVFSSHCLEHMIDPWHTILQWWELVKPGGHLILLVPDEDLYEQGIFPSWFNPDHKHTFRIHNRPSWSPASIHVKELFDTLPNAELISLLVHDHNYDYSKQKSIPPSLTCKLITFTNRCNNFVKRTFGFGSDSITSFCNRYGIIDQTLSDGVLAQIQCIAKKQ